MAIQRRLLVIDENTGAQKWDLAGALGSKVKTQRQKRLSRVVGEHVLPVLQKLESLAVKDKANVQPKLAGRGQEAVEQDDAAIETGLMLFDLAVAEGLIVFESKGRSLAKPGRMPSGPVGLCGMTIAEVKQHYLHLATQVIMLKGQDEKSKGILQERIQEMSAKTVADLPKVRLLAQFHPAALAELNQGLQGKLEQMLTLEEGRLKLLAGIHPTRVLRPLRIALKKHFQKVLEMDPRYLAAIDAGLDHPAKITAMGEDLLLVDDPDVIMALGAWPMKETQIKEGAKVRHQYQTRIAEVRQQLGREFELVLNSTPPVVREIGTWTNDQIGRFKPYLPHLGASAIEAMLPLPFDHRLGMLEGLWYKLGRDFIEFELHNEGGASVVRNVVREFKEMEKRGSAPNDLKTVIQNTDMFDGCMRRYLR